MRKRADPEQDSLERKMLSDFYMIRKYNGIICLHVCLHLLLPYQDVRPVRLRKTRQAIGDRDVTR